MASETTKTPKEKKNWLWRLIHGQLLTIDFFARHWLKILVCVIMILIYISNKYQCQTRMLEIDKLKKELEIVKNQSIAERSIYMGKIRESAMQDMVDSLKLNLHKQEQPPFKISYSK